MANPLDNYNYSSSEDVSNSTTNMADNNSENHELNTQIYNDNYNITREMMEDNINSIPTAHYSQQNIDFSVVNPYSNSDENSNFEHSQDFNYEHIEDTEGSSINFEQSTESDYIIEQIDGIVVNPQPTTFYILLIIALISSINYQNI